MAKKAKCSELAQAISDLATIVASQDGVNGLDDVVSEIQKTLPVVPREEIVNSIVDANTWEARQLSELSQKVTAMRAAARKESEPRRRKFLEKQTKEYERRIAEEDFEVRKKPVESPEIQAREKRLEKVIYERDLARIKLREAIEARKPKSLWEKGVGILQNAVPIRAGFDFSAIAIQNAFFLASHPIVTTGNIVEMLKAFSSPVLAKAINDELMTRNTAPLRLRAGVELSAVDGVTGLSARDELYRGAWVERLPVMRNFARAFPTFLNCMRADMFDILASSISRTGEPTLADAKQAALLVMEGTGVGMMRGKLGAKVNQAIPAARVVFWAPRLVLSKFEIALGHPVLSGLLTPSPGKTMWENLKNPEVSWRARRIMAQQYVRAATGMIAMYAMYMLMGWEPPETMWESTSSDFLKLQKGNLHLDPTGGIASVYTLLARIAFGKSTSATGNVTNLRDWRNLSSRDVEDVITDFTVYKFNPIFAAGYHVITGKKPFQTEDVTMLGEGLELVTPLGPSDIVDVAKEAGMPEGVLLAMLILAGVRIQNYNREAK